MPAPVYATALGGGLQFPLSLPYVASVSTAFTLGPNAAIGAAGASILAQIARQSAPAISTDHPVAFILIPRANVNSLGIVQSLTNAVEYTATSLSGNSLGGIAVINAGTDRGFEAGDFVSFACLAKHINDLATGKVSTGGDGSTLTGITAAQVGATTAAAVTTYVTGLGYLTTASAASTYSPLAGSSSIVTVGTLAAGAVPASLVTGTLGVGNGGNGLATATLGDLRYGSGTNTLAALAGNTAATVKVLTQTGTGTASAAPAWAPFVAGTDYIAGPVATDAQAVCPEAHIGCWGDSLTFGTGSANSVNGFPTQVQADWPYRQLHNYGVGGETSTQIKTRLLAASSTVKGYTTVIWAGRNNYSSPTTVLSDVAAMVAALGHTRYVVLSVLNTTAAGGETSGSTNYNTIISLNNALAAAYPGHYLDVRASLVAAWNGTTDAADHTADCPPTSLHSDTVHLNDAGYAVVKAAVETWVAANVAYPANPTTPEGVFRSVGTLLSAPTPIGAATPNTGAFTNLTATNVAPAVDDTGYVGTTGARPHSIHAGTGGIAADGNSVISGNLTVASGTIVLTPDFGMGWGGTARVMDAGAGSYVQMTGSGVIPSPDNSVPLGIPSQRWLQLHVGTGSSQFDGPVSMATPLGVTSGGNGLATATLGDLRYGSGTNTLAALAGNTAATVKVLTQTGTGTASAAPAWAPFVAGTDYLTPSGSGSGLSGVVLTSGNQSVSGIKTFTGQIKQDATGATTSIPSVLGISNLGSGTAAQFQFGNDSIVLQASFGGRLVANSFWGVEIGGNRQGSSGSASFTPGGATDPSLTVKGTTVGVPVIAAVGAASQTGKLVALRQISSTSTERNAGLIDAAWATSTDASRKGRVAVYAADSTGTDREGLRVESDGTQAMLGFYGSTAVAKQTVSGSRGSNAALASLITAIASLGFVTDSSS